jgi:hypothetical protein
MKKELSNSLKQIPQNENWVVTVAENGDKFVVDGQPGGGFKTIKSAKAFAGGLSYPSWAEFVAIENCNTTACYSQIEGKWVTRKPA